MSDKNDSMITWMPKANNVTARISRRIMTEYSSWPKACCTHSKRASPDILSTVKSTPNSQVDTEENTTFQSNQVPVCPKVLSGLQKASTNSILLCQKEEDQHLRPR